MGCSHMGLLLAPSRVYTAQQRLQEEVALMRLWLTIVLLLGLLSPALAHDDSYGLTNCFSGHCPQDTLVFGILTAESRFTYTLRVTKAIRKNAPLAEGTSIRLWRTGWNDSLGTGREPRLGEGFAVSFLRANRREPYQPFNLVCSTTTDWHKMTADTAWRTFRVAEYERVIRSGGRDDDFGGEGDATYLCHPNGWGELIFLDKNTRGHPAPPPSAAREPSPPCLLIIAVGSLVCFLAALAGTAKWCRLRRGR